MANESFLIDFELVSLIDFWASLECLISPTVVNDHEASNSKSFEICHYQQLLLQFLVDADADLINSKRRRCI